MARNGTEVGMQKPLRRGTGKGNRAEEGRTFSQRRWAVAGRNLAKEVLAANRSLGKAAVQDQKPAVSANPGTGGAETLRVEAPDPAQAEASSP